MESYGLVDKLPETSNIFRQFQAEGNRYQQTTREIIEEERPPMITIPEYRQRFGISD